MDSTMRIRLTAVFCLVALLLISGGRTWALTVITEEYPPFNFVAGGRVTGAATEVVREMMRRMGQVETIQVMPWARGYQLLRTRPDVVLFSTIRSAEREHQFSWVGPLYKITNAFFARKGSDVRLSSIEDAKKVGAIATYHDDVREQALESLGFTNLDSANSFTSNLKKLLSGRVDLWLTDTIGVYVTAKKLGVPADAVKMVFPFDDYSVYIAMSRQMPVETVRRWQNTLDGMKKDGSFFRISRKWLPAEVITDLREARPSFSGPAAELKIFTEDSPPGSYLKNGKPAGLAVEVVRGILRRLEVHGTIEMVPWARGYSMALSEPRVALFATTRLPQREALFQWVGPIYTQTWGFYARRDSKVKIHSLKEAMHVARIGTYHKDAKEQFLLAKGFANLVSANRNISNVKHLLRGDIDLWVSSDFNMPYLVRQAGEDPSQFKEAFAFRRVENYIVFSLKTPGETVAAWRRALAEMKRDGTYRRICARYDYKPNR